MSLRRWRRILRSWPSMGMSRFRFFFHCETKFCASRHHVFWPDSVSLTDRRIFNASHVRGHRQVTDVYLLGLARKMGGYLATLDGSILPSAVNGATRETIAVISTAAE